MLHERRQTSEHAAKEAPCVFFTRKLHRLDHDSRSLDDIGVYLRTHVRILSRADRLPPGRGVRAAW